MPSGRTLVIAVPFVFLLVFFLLPFLVVVKISVADSRLGVPRAHSRSLSSAP